MAAWGWCHASADGKPEPQEPTEPERVADTDPVPLVGGDLNKP